MSKGECNVCSKIVTLKETPGGLVLRKHKFAGLDCSGSNKPQKDFTKKFGYAYAMEIQRIEHNLRLERGIADTGFNSEIHFDAIKVYQENHKNDPSYRERQEAARNRGEKWVTPIESKTTSNFSLEKEEIEYLLEKLAGVNNPIGLQILSKLENWNNK